MRPIFRGQVAAPRQALQSKKPIQQLSSMRHVLASRALTPAFNQRQPTRLNRLPTIRSQTVSTKNGMHPLGFGPEWFDNGEAGLDTGARRRIAKAREDLTGHGQGVEASDSDIVAALSFGFWVSLLGKGGDLGTRNKASYHDTLWLPALRMAFLPAGGSLKRKQAYMPLYHLRAFRNRIAHHEPIFQRDLARDHKRILEVAGWISPVTAARIDHHSRVPELLARRNDAAELKF